MWQNDKYIYSPRTLKTIALCYETIYVGLPISYSFEITNEFELAEYKVDFDMALNAIGKGKWYGNVDGVFKYYRFFGRQQQAVIADIYGVEDWELEQLGFYQIPQLKGKAYDNMARFLNGLPYGEKFMSNSQKP